MGKSKIENVIRRLFGGVLVFSFAFIVALLSGSHFAPVSDGSAAPVSVVNQATGYYANITSTGSINITIQSTPDGAYRVGKDTLTIDTNTTTGYKLYISTVDHSSDTPSLPDTTPSNGLIDSASGSYLSPSTGAADTPVRLAVNTWGYVPSRSTNTETSTAYTDSDADPTSGLSVWRAVPEYGDEDIFYVNSNPATTSTNSVDVYYAVNASTALPSGTYSNTVVYTAIVDGGTDETGDTEASISPVSQDGLDSGQEVTIATSLYPGLSLSNLGDITVTIGDNACTDITPVLTEINSLNITCKAPAQDTYARYDVTITISKYDKTYTLEDAYAYMVYTGDTPAFYTLTNMQDMTHDICFSSEVITPTLTTMTNVLTKDNVTPFSTGTPQVTLTDTRDGKTYTVRKLPDGKCWMTRNLRYAPTTATRLSADTSDVLSTNTWTMPKLGTYNSSAADYDGDEVYEGAMDNGVTYDATYYSWHTATAGTGTSGMTTENTTQSICPKGWRLPTGGDGDGTILATTTGSSLNVVNGDFSQLDRAFGGTGESGSQVDGRANYMNTTYGLSTVSSLIGHFRSNKADYGGTVGVWWSSSAYNADRVWRLYNNPTYLVTQDNGIKGNSMAMFCVAR